MTTMPIRLALSKPFTKPIPFQGLCHHLGCCNKCSLSSTTNFYPTSSVKERLANYGGVHILIAVPPTSSYIIHVHRMFHMFHKPSIFDNFWGTPIYGNTATAKGCWATAVSLRVGWNPRTPAHAATRHGWGRLGNCYDLLDNFAGNPWSNYHQLSGNGMLCCFTKFLGGMPTDHERLRISQPLIQ